MFTIFHFFTFFIGSWGYAHQSILASKLPNDIEKQIYIVDVDTLYWPANGYRVGPATNTLPGIGCHRPAIQGPIKGYIWLYKAI